MIEFKILSCLFLFLFLIVATVDGFYFHLYKYKLYAREDSKKEHLLHSLNSLLFPFSVLFLFLDEFKGIYLWFGVFLTLISLVIEFMDVFEENKSRKSIGGLISIEYAMHFAMSALRGIYTTLILVSKPNSDWLLTKKYSPFVFSELSAAHFFIFSVVIIGVLVAILHFSLISYKNSNSKEIKYI